MIAPDEVTALIADGRREDALAGLIAAWRDSPATEIADAIDAIDAIEAIETSTATLDTKAWIDAITASRAAIERGALIRGISGRTMADTVACLELAVAWRDPRVFTVVRELLATLPWTGRRSTGQWRQIFAVLVTLGDPRTHALVETLPPNWTVGEPLQTFLPNRLRETVAKIPAVVSEPAYAVLSRAANAAKPKPAVSKSAASDAELLTAIYDNLDDDGPRIVYADWLQERDDPRGEFIALQLRGELDATAKKRERELLKKHGKAWLGPLAHVLSSSDLVWKRGFPTKATVQMRNQRDAETYGRDPSWATLEELTWKVGRNVRGDQEVWAGYIDPAMRGLREAVNPHHRFILETTTPWQFERLGLTAKDLWVEGFRAIAGAKHLLPKLGSLWLVGWGPEPAWLDGVTWLPEELELYATLDDEDLPAFLANAAKVANLTALTIHSYHGYRCTFTRDASKQLSRLAAVVEPRSISDLCALYRALPKHLVTSASAVAVAHDGTRTPIAL